MWETHPLALKNKDFLRSKLIDFWQWVAEGKKKYGEEQWSYDYWHDYIDYLPDEDMYYFDLQIFDSPEGDIWWRGKFKLKGKSIEILEEETNSSKTLILRR